MWQPILSARRDRASEDRDEFLTVMHDYLFWLVLVLWTVFTISRDWPFLPSYWLHFDPCCDFYWLDVHQCFCFDTYIYAAKPMFKASYEDRLIFGSSLLGISCLVINHGHCELQPDITVSFVVIGKNCVVAGNNICALIPDSL